jgi:hypothetical protein
MNKTYPNVEKVVIRMLIASTILVLIFGVFEIYGYRLKGRYTFQTITLTFIVTTLLFFSLFKNTMTKIVSLIFLTPLLASSMFVFTLGQPVYNRQMDEQNKISVSTGGFFACGEIIHITQTRFMIFDKTVRQIDDLCLAGIKTIKTINRDNKLVQFIIYHNGKLDSENPYTYTMARKNMVNSNIIMFGTKTRIIQMTLTLKADGNL